MNNLVRYDEELLGRIEKLLERIVQWSQAYPVDIFPKPDWKRAEEALIKEGMGVTSLSADAMRHVVEKLGEEARPLLEEIQNLESEASDENS